MSQKREITGATAEERYWSLIDHLEQIECELGHLDTTWHNLYLTDTSVDRENTEDCGLSEDDGEKYWRMRLAQAGSAAGSRAAEYGFNINDHFTEPIF